MDMHDLRGRLRGVLRSRRSARIEGGVGEGLVLVGCEEASYLAGSNEAPVQTVLAERLRVGGVFFDVGANEGFFSLIGARCVGATGAVYAFEPVARNVRRIRRNVRANRLGNITVFAQAVGASEGRERLLLARHWGGASLALAEEPPDLVGSVKVDVTTIDAVLERRTVRPPSLVKIDVEGAELVVLHGMEETIRSFAPDILFEVDGVDDRAAAAKAEACCAFLRTRGYSFERLADAYPANRWRVQHYLATAGASNRT